MTRRSSVVKDSSIRREHSVDTSNIGDITLPESFSSEVIHQKDIESHRSIDNSMNRMRLSSTKSSLRRRVIFPTVDEFIYKTNAYPEQPLINGMPRTILIQTGSNNLLPLPSGPSKNNTTDKETLKLLKGSGDPGGEDGRIQTDPQALDIDPVLKKNDVKGKDIPGQKADDQGTKAIFSPIDLTSITDSPPNSESNDTTSLACHIPDHMSSFSSIGVSVESVSLSQEASPQSASSKTSCRPSILKRSRSISIPLLPNPQVEPESTIVPQEIITNKDDQLQMQKTYSDSCINHMKKSNEEVNSVSPMGSPTANKSNAPNGNIDVKNSGIILPTSYSRGLFRGISSNVMSRHMSHEEMQSKRRIRFDPRVWVHEFKRQETENIWFTEKELHRFKQEAVARVRSWHLKHNNMISSGTGRIISTGNTPVCLPGKRGQRPHMRVLFSSPALSCEFEEEEDEEEAKEESKPRHSIMSQATVMKIKASIKQQFSSILLVDPHDVVLRLLAKSISAMLPHITITTAHTAKEAHEKILSKKRQDHTRTHGFDIIITEERLCIQHETEKPLEIAQKQNGDNTSSSYSSGSSLIQRIDKDIKDHYVLNDKRNQSPSYPLLIGISTSLNQDMPLFIDRGADLVWGKPPPAMDSTLASELLMLIAQKRNRSDILQTLYNNHI